MKRALLTAVTLALASLTLAPTFAGATDFKTSAGIKKFWQDIADTRR
jgi:hypothetical protein